MTIHFGAARHLDHSTKSIYCIASGLPIALYIVCNLQSTEQDISWGALHDRRLTGMHLLPPLVFVPTLMLCRAPLYPPKSVSFEIGFSLNHMQPVPGRYQVQLTDRMQTFQLPASTSMGHFFKIIMHGKLQQQFEDRQYFTAIRRVKIVGRILSAADVNEASQLVCSGQLALPQLSSMPATLCRQLICQQLESMTVHSRYNVISAHQCT